MLRKVITKRLLYGEGSGDGLPGASQRTREIGIHCGWPKSDWVVWCLGGVKRGTAWSLSIFVVSPSLPAVLIGQSMYFCALPSFQKFSPQSELRRANNYL